MSVTAIPSADHSIYFIECGVTALRGEDGKFLPAIPLYVAVDRADLNPRTGSSPGETELLGNIEEVLAEKFAAYVAGCRQLERLRKEKGGKDG